MKIVEDKFGVTCMRGHLRCRGEKGFPDKQVGYSRIIVVPASYSPSLKGSIKPPETALNGTDLGRPNEEFPYIEVLAHTKLLSWWADEQPVRFIGTREEEED